MDLIQDISTLPGDAYKFYANGWLKHKNIFEKKPSRLFSVLSPDVDIADQFDELRSNVIEYQDDYSDIKDILMKAIPKFQQRDKYDLSDIGDTCERMSILSGFLLTEISEEKFLSAKKLLLAYALNGDLGEDIIDSYNVCKQVIYNNYINIIDKNKKTIPSFDVVIAESILAANNYSDEPYIDSFDILTDAFNTVYKNFPGAKEQFELIINSWEYLGIYKK